jgi:hypothetical protein
MENASTTEIHKFRRAPPRCSGYGRRGVDLIPRASRRPSIMTNWTEEDLDRFLARNAQHGCVSPARNTADTSSPPFALAAKGYLALGRLKTGEMNKTEAAYDAYLWQQVFAREVLWHKFEGIKLRLADKTFYTCDFAVLKADFTLEMHEVKGFMQDDANVKIKVAASMYPFRFVLVKKTKGGWNVRPLASGTVAS